MTTTPREPGWHDDPEGRRRWWDGQRWGAYAPWDDRGAVARPIAPRPVGRIDGRYLHDGTTGGQAPRSTAQHHVVVHHVVQRPAKDLAIAYLLLIFLGVFGAHRYYLGHLGTAITILVGTVIGPPLLLVLGIGLLPLIGVVIWWIVDLFLLPGMVRAANAPAPSAAPGYERGWPAA